MDEKIEDRQGSSTGIRKELELHMRQDAELFGRLDERMTWMFRVMGGIAFLIVLGFSVLGYIAHDMGNKQSHEQSETGDSGFASFVAVSDACQWKCSNFCGHFQSPGCWSYCVAVICGE